MKKCLTILFLICSFSISAQLEADNWIYQSNFRVNFNGASQPSVFPTPSIYMSGNGSFTMSNKSTGDLEFFGGGSNFGWITINDKNYQKFPSIALHTPGLYGAREDGQSALCVPILDVDSTYYIFHMKQEEVPLYRNITLYYSKVDLRLRGGLGEVVPGQANIPLLGGSRVQLKLTSALHCNKKDVWVIGHLFDSDKYFSILVKSNGTVMPPVYFNGATIPIGDYLNFSHKGSCKVSPRGDKLAAAFLRSNIVELFDFNNVTGIGTNLKTITNFTVPDTILNYLNGPLGVGFSPSGNKLYVTSNYEATTSTPVALITQFDATLPTAAAINASAYIFNTTSLSTALSEMQLGNNSKLYVISGGLCEINYPENSGASCGLSIFPPDLLLTNTGSFPSLPTFLESYFRFPLIATGNCQFQNMSFSIQNPIGVSSVLWNFGDPASGVNNTSTSFTPTHIFSGQGSYMVKAVLQNSNGCGADTIRKLVYAGQYGVNLGNDTSYCRGDSIRLKMHIPLGRTTWSTGSTDTAIYIKQPGTYWVRVNLGECVASDTIVITENALPQFSLGADTVICNNANVTLAPNPNYASSSYVWSNATTSATNTVNTAGLHWLQLTDSKGCKWRDSTNVSFKTLPNYTLGNDTAICQKDTIIFNATVAGVTNYTWNTAATTPTIKAFTTNTYWCDLNKDGCIYRDSVNLLVKPLPIVNLGNDTTICEDKTYTLNAANASSTYLWQDGATTPTYTINQAGTYNVTVTKSNCVTKDTTVVQYQLRPRFSLGTDKLICPGLTFILDPQLTNTGLTYIWQDGATTPTYTVTNQGLYYVAVSNYCGGTTDSIQITKGLCKVYVPTAFTPNNDGVNDVFKVGGGEAVKDFKLIVYNRWGQKIMETKNIQQGWNGTINNTIQPTGVYIYYVEYKDVVTNEQFRMKGTIMLLR